MPPGPPPPFQLPAGFRFGVATAGFQTEGGFNGRGEPANNWAGWERQGRVEPSSVWKPAVATPKRNPAGSWNGGGGPGGTGRRG